MKDVALFNIFLKKIEQKIPQKKEIINVLADVLHTDKEAVYKKLKREVPFTFHEILTISKQLGFSLDSLNADSISKKKPSNVSLIEYISPAEGDFALMEEMTSILKSFKNIKNPEAAEITNILPQPLYVLYENISRFYLLKWEYQSYNLSKTTPYKDIIITDKLRKTQEEYVKWAKRLHADYIFDYLLFYYLVTDIKYFYHVGLITHEEVQLLKQDLFRILEEINLLTRTGFFEETGQTINIYVSNVNIDTNYIYVATPDYHLTIIKAFLINGIASTDKKTFDEVKHRVQSTKRQSTLITKSGEKERIDFFEKQHNFIESLSHL